MRICDINWGDDSAEKDPNLLEYFVDSDALRRLMEKTKSIVIGRKGSGKSALRKKLEEQFSKDENTFVVNISPRYLSIRNVLNDKDLIENFGQEVFFQHTWLRQILLDCLTQIGDRARGRYAKESLAFARDVAVELKRTSKDLVENIADVLGRLKMKCGKLGDLGLQLEKELRAAAEVEALEHHVCTLAEAGVQIIILVDDLDLGWDNSETANNILLGLLSAIGHLSACSKNIYCCIFLREDVYSVLIGKTQHADKYRNVERIRWEKDNLISILNKRINFNRRLHGLDELEDSFHSVFPSTIGTNNTDNWLLERTLSRPRELIQLARYYTESVDAEEPSDTLLKESEAAYSGWKLDDLCSEYSNQYPGLVSVFSYWKTKFFRRKYHLTKDEIDDMLTEIAVEVDLNQAWFNKIVDEGDMTSFLKYLYEIGFIGDFVLGGEGGSKTFYSYNDRHEPLFSEIQIHPCFRKAVNTVDRIRRKKAAEGTEAISLI